MAATAETAGNAATTLIDRHIAASKGDKPALKYGDKRYNYNDVAALTNRAGNLLRRLGVQPGRHVLVALGPSPALIATILGAMKIGAIPVLAQAGSLRALTNIIKDLHPGTIVVETGAKKEAFALAGETPVLVVGETEGEELSFVELLRESPSSLSSVAVEENATALKIVEDGDVRVLSHKAVSGDELEAWFQAFPALARSLRALAQGKEATIPRPA